MKNLDFHWCSNQPVMKSNLSSSVNAGVVVKSDQTNIKSNPSSVQVPWMQIYLDIYGDAPLFAAMLTS